MTQKSEGNKQTDVREAAAGVRLGLDGDCGGDMTVLEEVTMSSTLGGDRYITPEYLAPLPQVHITDHSFEQTIGC